MDGILAKQQQLEEIGRELGDIAGRAVKRFKARLGVLRFVKYLAIPALIVIALPPVVQYWLSHIAFPAVPISAIVAMFCAALVLFAFGFVMWVALTMMREMLDVQMYGCRRRGAVSTIPTGGSFSVPSDDRMWAVEQLEDLKKKGFLTDSDTRDIEEKMKELLAGTMGKKRQ